MAWVKNTYDGSISLEWLRCYWCWCIDKDG